MYVLILFYLPYTTDCEKSSSLHLVTIFIPTWSTRSVLHRVHVTFIIFKCIQQNSLSDNHEFENPYHRQAIHADFQRRERRDSRMLDGIDSCNCPVADGWLLDVRSLVLELERAAATQTATLDPDILSDPSNFTRLV